MTVCQLYLCSVAVLLRCRCSDDLGYLVEKKKEKLPIAQNKLDLSCSPWPIPNLNLKTQRHFFLLVNIILSFKYTYLISSDIVVTDLKISINKYIKCIGEK